MFETFDSITFDLPDARIHGRVGGAGEPLLLLHGFPQTHVMWHDIVDELAKSYRVIVPDLRGYGRSVAKTKDFTFRAMAQDQVALMRHLGHATFHVVAHDRGARVAHRMVLDHPDTVRSVALFDILPTLDVWRTMDDWLAKRYYHWTFLAQPNGLPQRLINADPVFYMRSALMGLSGPSDIFHPDAMAAYEDAAKNPDVVAAWCADYAAAAELDVAHDRANLGETHKIDCLVLWGKNGVVGHHLDPLEAWQVWFPNATGYEIDAGHFLVEERPDEVLAALKRHLSGVTSPQGTP